MAKGGESLGNEEGSEEEEEVIPSENYTPRVRLLTLGVVLSTATTPNGCTMQAESVPAEKSIFPALRQIRG
jgi:hypothetical protein